MNIVHHTISIDIMSEETTQRDNKGGNRNTVDVETQNETRGRRRPIEYFVKLIEAYRSVPQPRHQIRNEASAKTEGQQPLNL